MGSAVEDRAKRPSTAPAPRCPEVPRQRSQTPARAVSAVLRPGQPDSAGAQFFVCFCGHPPWTGFTGSGASSKGWRSRSRLGTPATPTAIADRVEIRTVRIRTRARGADAVRERDATQLAGYRAVLETTMGEVTLDSSRTGPRATCAISCGWRISFLRRPAFHRVVPGFVVQTGALSTRKAAEQKQRPFVLNCRRISARRRTGRDFSRWQRRPRTHGPDFFFICLASRLAGQQIHGVRSASSTGWRRSRRGEAPLNGEDPVTGGDHAGADSGAVRTLRLERRLIAATRRCRSARRSARAPAWRARTPVRGCSRARSCSTGRPVVADEAEVSRRSTRAARRLEADGARPVAISSWRSSSRYSRARADVRREPSALTRSSRYPCGRSGTARTPAPSALRSSRQAILRHRGRQRRVADAGQTGVGFDPDRRVVVVPLALEQLLRRRVGDERDRLEQRGAEGGVGLPLLQRRFLQVQSGQLGQRSPVVQAARARGFCRSFASGDSGRATLVRGAGVADLAEGG